MLDQFCQFIDGLGNVDDGVESVLTPSAFDGLKAMVLSVYGNHAAEVFENCFTQREDSSFVMAIENPSEAFRLTLTGTG